MSHKQKRMEESVQDQSALLSLPGQENSKLTAMADGRAMVLELCWEPAGVERGEAGADRLPP